MRLIDADALKSEFEWLKSVVNESSKDEIQEYIQRIENAPTVDAVILPCKPGSTVFQIDRYPDDETCGDCPSYCPPFPGDPGSCLNDDGYFRRVDCMTISETVATIEYILSCIKFNWFGEFVFLTREEAEAALAKMGGEKDGN